MNRNGKRDDSLDAVKGFAILIVMLGHCIVLNGLADAYIYDAIAAIQMPLFMAVSGYVAGKRPLILTQRPDGKKWSLQLGRRTLSYLLPFFVWMFLTHLKNPLDELKLQLFALDRGLWFLMTLWIVTLVVMIAGYVADSIAWKCKRKAIVRFIVFCLVVGICYLGFFVQGRSGNTFLSPSLTVKYLPFYVAGYFWALYVAPLIQRAEKNADIYKTLSIGKIVLWILSIAAFIYLIAAFDMIVAIDTITLAAQMLGSFRGTYACFYGIYRFAGGRFKRLLAFIGQYTLEIYVLHFRFARLLGIGGKSLQLYSLEALLWIAAAFAVMSVLTALCIWLIKKVKVLDLLLFGKNNIIKSRS